MPATIDILLNEPIGVIDSRIYGHFAEHLGGCVYDGIFVGQDSKSAHTGGVCDDVVAALKQIKAPVIRWPGGCFADDYHWRDGVGPVEGRPRGVNLHWGQVVENNHFGTHEFIRFCRSVGAEPYLAGNLGSGTVQELRDWVEYCNYPGASTLSDMRKANGDAEPFNVKLWGIGNENWGCGGNFSPEDYAAEFKQYATYVRKMGNIEPVLIACGPDGNNVEWTRRFFEKLMRDFGTFPRIGGFTPHYYCGTAGRGSAAEFSDSEWYELLFKAMQMETLVTQQRALMDEYDPQRKIGMMIDEWGTWHFPTPGRNPAFLWQQNTLRDALVAALTLNIFNRHADKVVMSNIAQAVNVLQALLLTEEGKTVRTPTFHVYDLYQNHQGARSVRTVCNSSDVLFNFDNQMKKLAGLSASASIKGRTLTLTVVNARLSDEPTVATIQLKGDAASILTRETILTHGDPQTHNTFDDPTALVPSEPTVISLTGQTMNYGFAPQSVTRLEMSLA